MLSLSFVLESSLVLWVLLFLAVPSLTDFEHMYLPVHILVVLYHKVQQVIFHPPNIIPSRADIGRFTCLHIDAELHVYLIVYTRLII